MKLRKYKSLDEKEKTHLENMRSSRNVINLSKKDEIPFGIRALEAGIEVEGVVVSRPVTPLSSPRSINGSVSTLIGSGIPSKIGSHAGSTSSLTQPQPVALPVFSPATVISTNQSPRRGQPPRVYQPSPYLNMPPQAAFQNSSRSSISSSMYSGSSATMSRQDSGEFTPPSSASNSPPVETAFLHKFPPSPLTQNETGLPMTPEEGALAKLEGTYDFQNNRSYSAPHLPTIMQGALNPSTQEDSPYLRPVMEGEPALSTSSSESSAYDFEFPFKRPAFANRTSSIPSDSVRQSAHSSLSMLDLHRMSHAAEVGQLHSRRKAGLSSQNSSMPTTPDAKSALTFPDIRPVASAGDGSDEQFRESQQWVMETLDNAGITRVSEVPPLPQLSRKRPECHPEPAQEVLKAEVPEVPEVPEVKKPRVHQPGSSKPRNKKLQKRVRQYPAEDPYSIPSLTAN